jgi:hypothetical protein
MSVIVPSSREALTQLLNIHRPNIHWSWCTSHSDEESERNDDEGELPATIKGNGNRDKEASHMLNDHACFLANRILHRFAVFVEATLPLVAWVS